MNLSATVKGNSTVVHMLARENLPVRPWTALMPTSKQSLVLRLDVSG